MEQTDKKLSMVNIKQKALIIAVSILIVMFTAQSYRLDRTQTKLEKSVQEVDRLSDNQTSLIADVEYYRTEDSLSVASVHKLTLTLGEYQRLDKAKSDTIKDLGYKLSRVNSVQEVKTESNYKIKVPIKNQTLPNNSTTPCFNYSSPFLDVTGCVIDSTLHAEIKMRADLQIIAHRVPKQWWFIKWGTKAVKVDVISKDRNCSITHNRYIELE